MKVLILVAILATAILAHPVVKTWTLNQLSEVLETSKGDPAMKPYYEKALNQIMYALYTGTNENEIHALIISPSGKRKWTESELVKAVEESSPSSAYLPFLQRSLHYLQYQNSESDEAKESVEVVVPALDISTWSVNDVSEAINNSNTKSELMAYLQKANDEINEALVAGKPKENVTIVTPVGLVPRGNGPRPIIISRHL